MDIRSMCNPVAIQDALDIVTNARAYVYTPQAPGASKSLAIEAQSLTGDGAIAVSTDCVGFRTTHHEELVPVLFAAVQELAKEVASLKKAKKASK